jgi:hypothetical protein
MASSAPLDLVPLWALMIALFVGSLVFDECGFRIGRLIGRASRKESDTTIATIVAAELGLLGFLLAFTFGIVAARFDLRRQMVLNEANAIGTAYLRAEMLPDPQSASIRGLLRSYIDEVLRQSDEIHQRLWAEAVAAAAHDPRSVQTGLFVESLNDVIDLHAARIMAAVRSRMPLPVWIVLFALEMVAFFTIGYQAGLTTATRSSIAIVLALALCAVIWLVADLDRPGEGFLRVGQEPMIEVHTMMQREP